MGGLLHLVQRGGDWAGPQPAPALLAVPNVTAHPSTASVPITVLLYMYGFDVPVKMLTETLYNVSSTLLELSEKKKIDYSCI